MNRTSDLEHVSKPHRPSLFRVLRRSGYWKCLSCTLLLFVCIFYFNYCHIKHTAYSATQPLLIHQHGPCAQGYNFVPVVFGLMLYMVYIMECWHSRTKLSKLKKIKSEEMLDYLNGLRDALPIVWWKSICYHYVRRTRQITRYRNGDAVPATQVYYERVNSHTAGNVFLYESVGVKDISKAVQNLQNFALTRIRINRGFVFACMQAANEFEEQRTRFFNENENRDDYMEVREGMDLTESAVYDDVLCYHNAVPPWYLHPICFWVLSSLLLSWPLRIYAECRTAVLNYHITKLFGTNYLSPSSINYTGPLTRTSTMETVELESTLRRQQYFIVPSYSEAMLMAPNGNNDLTISNRMRLYSPHAVSNNEPVVIANYGALDEALESQRPLSASQSMTFNAESRDTVTRSSRIPLSTRRIRLLPPRSLSISGVSGWSNGYQLIDSSPHGDASPLIQVPNEPPPPYELALRMCAPLYERVRRSISSRLNSISHSSSKDLKAIPPNNQNNNSP